MEEGYLDIIAHFGRERLIVELKAVGSSLGSAKHIDSFGHEALFYQTKHVYYDHDGYTYWHMGNIINRCPIADIYHQRERAGRFPI